MARYCGFKENETPFVYRDKAMTDEARPSPRTGGLCGDEGLISRTEELFDRPLKALSCGEVARINKLVAIPIKLRFPGPVS